MKYAISSAKILSILLISLWLSGCVGQNRVNKTVRPDNKEVSVSTHIYFFPKNGQSAIQQDRDRYECYLWSIDQSGFNPSSIQLAPHQQVIVQPDPPEGHDAVLGTVSGAIVGAMIGSPHHTGGSAALGAVAGAMLGAASDSSRREQAEELEDQINRRAAYGNASIERKAQDYRRAMKACLEGRGYSVR